MGSSKTQKTFLLNGDSDVVVYNKVYTEVDVFIHGGCVAFLSVMHCIKY